MAVYLGDKKVDFLGGQSVNISMEGIDTSDATATASDIRTNRTAYVNGEKVTGKLTESNLISLTGENVSFSEGSSSGSGGTSNKISISITSGNETILKSNSSIDVNIEASNFGDATASDVLNGKTFTSVNGLKVTGTHICDEGLDTSDADATAEDIAEGVIAYARGQQIIGTVTRYKNDDSYAFEGDAYRGQNGSISIGRTTSQPEMMDSGVFYSITASGDNFGDATTADVAQGKTFTSVNGLKLTGTGIIGGTSGGYTSGDMAKAKAISLSLGTFSSWGTTSLSVTKYTNLIVVDGDFTATSTGSVVFDSTSDTGNISDLREYYVLVNNQYYYIPSTANCTITGSYSYTVTVSEANPMFIIA